VCADAYPGPGPYRSFATVVQPFLDWASHHRKPIMIGEYGVPADTSYGPWQRAQWLWGAARTVQRVAHRTALGYSDANAKPAHAPPAARQRRPGRRWRFFIAGAALALAALGVATARLFVWPPHGMPAQVDAIVMLNGPGDRLDTALRLAWEGRAHVVVVSQSS